MDKLRLGIGFVGAGPVVQAIHLPTVARLSSRLWVTHVMDPNVELARQVAEPLGARASNAIEGLLQDPQVDIVVICSPPRFHAEQVEAAIAAGKRAILCEKPLAVEIKDAEAAIQAARDANIPLIVGAMHRYDPEALAAIGDWRSADATASLIRSSIVLPQNTALEDWATEMLRPPYPVPPASPSPIRDAVLSLAVHDLPLIRMIAGNQVPRVVDATWFAPFGYAITWLTGTTTVQMEGFFHQLSTVSWELDVYSDNAQLHLDFPPSYVHAGSARSFTRDRAGMRARGPVADDGYLAEWRHLIELVDRQSVEESEDALDDLRLVVALADQAQTVLNEKGA